MGRYEFLLHLGGSLPMEACEPFTAQSLFENGNSGWKLPPYS